MAVPCPRCGREYDVTLFQFGRTLHCTCGARVGLEPRVRAVAADREPRFVADAMLGRLARWMRAMGYDTRYDARIADGDLVRIGVEEGRVILTRDRGLPEEWRAGEVVVLESESPLTQLREVAHRFGLDWRARAFSRCTRCNTPVEPLSRGAARGRVPPRVLAERDRFSSCPGCGRVYWEGSHTARMRRLLERALGS